MESYEDKIAKIIYYNFLAKIVADINRGIPYDFDLQSCIVEHGASLLNINSSRFYAIIRYKNPDYCIADGIYWNNLKANIDVKQCVKKLKRFIKEKLPKADFTVSEESYSRAVNVLLQDLECVL